MPLSIERKEVADTGADWQSGHASGNRRAILYCYADEQLQAVAD